MCLFPFSVSRRYVEYVAECVWYIKLHPGLWRTAQRPVGLGLVEASQFFLGMRPLAVVMATWVISVVSLWPRCCWWGSFWITMMMMSSRNGNFLIINAASWWSESLKSSGRSRFLPGVEQLTGLSVCWQWLSSRTSRFYRNSIYRQQTDTSARGSRCVETPGTSLTIDPHPTYKDSRCSEIRDSLHIKDWIKFIVIVRVGERFVARFKSVIIDGLLTQHYYYYMLPEMYWRWWLAKTEFWSWSYFTCCYWNGTLFYYNYEYYREGRRNSKM